MYLVAVLDWYSRYVIAWELDQTLELPFVLIALERALAQASPTICNSDQGSHFTSPQYRQLLQAADVQISMDGKGRAIYNIFTERLWRTIKYEEVYFHEYESPKDARQHLRDYLQFYNHQRLHQALDYRPPAALYFAPRSCVNDAEQASTGEEDLPISHDVDEHGREKRFHSFLPSILNQSFEWRSCDLPKATF